MRKPPRQFPYITLFFANCSFAKNFDKIAKLLCCSLFFLKIIKHNTFQHLTNVIINPEIVFIKNLTLISNFCLKKNIKTHLKYASNYKSNIGKY